MTTTVAFTPSLTAAFQFDATLDGELYNIVVTWNFYAQRYYINIYDSSNQLVVCKSMVGSPADYDLNLVANYFQSSTLVWREVNNQFEIAP